MGDPFIQLTFRERPLCQDTMLDTWSSANKADMFPDSVDMIG